MKLVQITSQHMIDHIRGECFSFETPLGTQVMMHEIQIDGQSIGYVATEDFGAVGSPHLFVRNGYRNANYLGRAEWLFKHVYRKLMKELGKKLLVTTCAQDDPGTINFMERCGFTIQKVVVAEMIL